MARVGVETLYIEPGSETDIASVGAEAWQNRYAESFNSRFRDEFLAVELFESLKEARAATKEYQDDYNRYQPHSSLSYQTPIEFADSLGRSEAGTPLGAASIRATQHPNSTQLFP